MKKLLLKLRTRVLNVLTPEPEIKEEYVNKVVYLLRRDFTTAEQNEIVISIIKKLSENRAKDMIDMENKYQVLQKDTTFLRESISI